MNRLPEGVAEYRRTPVFDAASVPAALLDDHALKSGVWGLLCVERGCVTYRDASSGDETALTAGARHVVPPETPHSVALSEDAAFWVAFHR